MKSQEKELALLKMKELALEAGGMVMSLYGKDYSTWFKEDNSPVTMADLRAERIIRQGLLGSFPLVSILSEETKDNRGRL